MKTFHMMLYEFITSHRETLIALTRAKIAARLAPRAIDTELQLGVPLFMDQLTQALEPQLEPPRSVSVHEQMGQGAARHGQEMLRRGFTVAQLVHDYGAICQSITQLANEEGLSISADDYRTLNGFLDDAIAHAVTEYGSQREQVLSEEEAGRLGFLAHELRNLLSSASLAYQALRSGRVGIGGNTGDTLGRSLKSLRNLIDRSLAQVRLSAENAQQECVRIAELIEDVETTATLDAEERRLQFLVIPADYGLMVMVDRQLIQAAVANLVQNAFKFTRPGGRISLRVRASDGHALIEVEDECGGLPPGKAEELFHPYAQRGADRSGLGLGLTISLRIVKASGGDITVRDLPGKGCVFTIALPLAAPSLPVQ